MNSTPTATSSTPDYSTLTQNKLDKHLLHASETGELLQVKELLSAGANKEAQTIWQNSPLQLAVRQDHTEIAKILIAAKANIDTQGQWQHTPLHWTARRGRTETAKLLICSGANIEAIEENQYTPLHFAAEEGHTEITKLLIIAGANIDALTSAKSVYGKYTPLHFAARHGRTEIAKLLIVAGANIDALTSTKTVYSKYTPLLFAVEEGHTEIAKLLIVAGTKINAQSKHNSTALNIASEDGHSDIVKLLLINDANIYLKDNDGDTPLHCASKKGHMEIVKLLISAGAKIHTKNKTGKTSLQLAHIYKHTEIENLIRSLEDTLFSAAQTGDLQAIKKVIKSIDINYNNLKGHTALHLAAQYGQIEITRYLIDHGANMFARTSFLRGKTPLDISITHKQTKIRNLLLFEMIKTGQKWALDKYIGFKLDLNKQDQHGKTLLHWAIINNKPLIMNKILSMDNIDLTIRDNAGNTPNHYAIEKELPSLNKRIMTQSIANCFGNIVGLDKQIDLIKPTCKYLSNPIKNFHLKAVAFHALLLYGPRGTGKTMTAKSLAREAACEFVELKLKTRSLENIKQAYNRAFAKAPAILFIDEIDQVAARDRNTKDLLIELIRQKTDAPVVVAGTTNWIEKLDKNVLKAFERVAQIKISLPTLASKKILLKRFIKSYLHGIDFNDTLSEFIDQYILKTRSKSGRELKELTIQACRNAQFRTKIENPRVTKDDLWKALNDQDPVRNMLITSLDRRLKNHTVEDRLIAQYSEKLGDMGQQNIELFVQKIKSRIDNTDSALAASSTQVLDLPKYFQQAFKEITSQIEEDTAAPTATASQEIHYHTHIVDSVVITGDAIDTTINFTTSQPSKT